MASSPPALISPPIPLDDVVAMDEPIRIFIPLTLPNMNVVFTFMFRIFFAPGSFSQYATHTDPITLLPIASCALASMLYGVYCIGWPSFSVIACAASFLLLSLYGHTNDSTKWTIIQIFTVLCGYIVHSDSAIRIVASMVLFGLCGGVGSVIIGHPLPAASAPISMAIGLLLSLMNSIAWFLFAVLLATVVYIGVSKVLSGWPPIFTGVSVLLALGGVGVVWCGLLSLCFAAIYYFSSATMRQMLVEGCTTMKGRVVVGVGGLCGLIVLML